MCTVITSYSIHYTKLYEATKLDGPYDAVIDCSNDVAAPARAADIVEPGGRVVFIGLRNNFV